MSLFIPVPVPQSQAKEAKPDVVEELMKKMFMRKVMAKFFGSTRNKYQRQHGPTKFLRLF